MLDILIAESHKDEESISFEKGGRKIEEKWQAMNTLLRLKIGSKIIGTFCQITQSGLT